MDLEYKDIKSDVNYDSHGDTEKENVIQEDDFNEMSGDEPDKDLKLLRVTNFDIFLLIVSILSHIVDVALDINLAYRYYRHQQTVYFLLTVVFILFPAFVNTGISIRM